MKKSTRSKKPLILIILDGWGMRKADRYNAIARANTPNFDYYWRAYPHCKLKACGEAVGLPKGFLGNSEVGHLNIGSGRVMPQMLTQINDRIKDGSFFTDKELIAAVKNCKKHNSTLHLMGLVQDAGVHAHLDHCIALLKIAKQHDLKDILIHVFTDGRDTTPKSAAKYISKIQKAIKKFGRGKIATIIGRYYAMDRDNRWERTRLAYNALADAKGKRARSVKAAIADAYKKKETDEFIRPRIIGDYSGVQDKDSMIFFNYRLDRARQLTHAFTDKKFSRFKRKKKNITYVAFTEYYKDVPALVAFEEHKLKNILGAILSKNKLKQLRIAETEKYAHVTFFFNGEVEKPLPGEHRIIIPSPKVSTYDKTPAMSAYKITRTVISEIKKNRYDVIILNFANSDMVGHTGNILAAIKAVAVIDECLGKICRIIAQKQGTAIITADHGNSDDMRPEDITAHSMSPVPFIILKPKLKLRDGKLADIAPTMLKLLGIKKPKEMTGKNLIL
jgi:2,3-bisphosphoglycerate-independent phosphoglycerate mutase